MKTQNQINLRSLTSRTLKPIKLGTTTRLLLAVCLLCLFAALTRAETAVQAWVQRYNGQGNTNDYATAMAVDGSNNVIVTGYSMGSGSGYDYATIKYSSAGVPLWTNRYGGPISGSGNDQAYAVAVDVSNNVIVTGWSTAGPSGPDYATIKYSSDGVPLWTNRYTGPASQNDIARAVAVDGSNNVIVTGSSVASASYADYATLKYSSDGVPLWTNRYNGPGNNSDYATAVAVDSSNNVIVTGYSAGSGGTLDYATLKYSSAGVPLRTNRYDGPVSNEDRATALAVDGSNNVIVTGWSYAFYSPDYVTFKFSSAGVALWTKDYDGTEGLPDYASAVAVDGSNNVIVTGSSARAGSGLDYATIKYRSSDGVPLWTNRYNGPGNSHDCAQAVAVDRSNNVIVTGYSVGNGGYTNYATIKYSSAGVPLWTNHYDGPVNGDHHAVAMAVDHSGNVIVTGYSTGSEGDYDFATIKYICVPEPVMTGLQLADGTVQLRVDQVLQPGTLVIEASTNLTGWEAIFTNTTPTNVLFYTDPEAGSNLWRFYRAFQFP